MYGRCCFNHLIGLPEKHRVKHNLYLYEYNLFAELMKDKLKPTDDITNRQQHKHVAVIKATGLGITEFVLRWIAWMCVRNDDFKGKSYRSQYCFGNHTYQKTKRVVLKS
jgi:hypothetical protein